MVFSTSKRTSGIQNFQIKPLIVINNNLMFKNIIQMNTSVKCITCNKNK